jgi:hypothetical protein
MGTITPPAVPDTHRGCLIGPLAILSFRHCCRLFNAAEKSWRFWQALVHGTSFSLLIGALIERSGSRGRRFILPRAHRAPMISGQPAALSPQEVDGRVNSGFEPRSFCTHRCSIRRQNASMV